MELTFYTDLGDSFQVEIDPNMELENVMALLEAEVSEPKHIFFVLSMMLTRSLFTMFLVRYTCSRTKHLI